MTHDSTSPILLVYFNILIVYVKILNKQNLLLVYMFPFIPRKHTTDPVIPPFSAGLNTSEHRIGEVRDPNTRLQPDSEKTFLVVNFLLISSLISLNF